MYKRFVFIPLFLILHACNIGTLSHAYVKNTIEDMIERDQAARFPINLDAMRKVDAENAPEVKKIIDYYGVPQKTHVGEEAVDSFITLVLHLDDITYKKKVLKQLGDYVQQGIIHSSDYAYLYDKIAIHEGKKQKWGTQGNCTEHGTWEPDETEDPENLNARRKEMGLPPIQEYATLVTAMACSSQKHE